MDAKTKLAMKKKAAIFKALGHPSRIFMIEQIAKENLCVCKFVEMLNIDKSTVSKHLRILKNAGIISTQKSGKNQICSLRMPCIVQMLDCAQQSNAAEEKCENTESCSNSATCKQRVSA